MRLIVLLISILSLQAASAGILDFNLWKADSKLKEEKYADAVNDYLKIQAQDPANSRLNYNLGIGLYRLGAFENAAFNFQQAAQKSQSAILKEKSLYNLGNSLFKKEDYETAIKAYEAALKIDTEDEDTKFNLELAKKKLQEQQQNQDQNKDDQNQDQQNQDQQNKDKQDNKDQKDQDKQDQENKDQQDQNQDQNKDQNKDKNKQDQQKDSEPKEKKGDLDEQEIKMLLMQVKEGKPKGKSLGVKSKAPSDPKAKKKPW